MSVANKSALGKGRRIAGMAAGFVVSESSVHVTGNGRDQLEMGAFSAVASSHVSVRRSGWRVLSFSEPFPAGGQPQFVEQQPLAGLRHERIGDGLALFNRFYQPNLDLDTLNVVPRLVLSSSEELCPAAALDRHPVRPHHTQPGQTAARADPHA